MRRQALHAAVSAQLPRSGCRARSWAALVAAPAPALHYPVLPRLLASAPLPWPPSPQVAYRRVDALLRPGLLGLFSANDMATVGACPAGSKQYNAALDRLEAWSSRQPLDEVAHMVGVAAGGARFNGAHARV